MASNNRAPEGSPRTKALIDQIEKFYEEHGVVDWTTLGITYYMRKYHGLDEAVAYLLGNDNEPDTEDFITLSDVSFDPEIDFGDRDVEKLDVESPIIITCGEVGCPLNTQFVAVLKNMARHKKARLLLVPQAQKKKDLSEAISFYKIYEPGMLDLAGNPINPPELACWEEEGFEIIIDPTLLHKHLSLYPLFINPKVANPITGLRTLAPKLKNAVIASPKQRLESFPSPKDHLPYLVASTGAVTESPIYENFMLTKQELIAEHDHQLGAIIIEPDGECFHMRHVISKDGGYSVRDFDGTANKYTSEAVSSAKLLGMVPGDWHSGYTDVEVATVLMDVAEKNDIDEVVLHDTDDGHSTNPHEKHQNMTLTQKALSGMLSVECEIVGVAHDLLEWEKIVKRVSVVRSNHDEFLDREIENGKYTSHPFSAGPLTIIAGALTEHVYATGSIPYALPIAIEKIANNIYKVPKLQKTVFLERDVAYYIAGVDVSHHGDKLINGRPTNLANIAASIPLSVTGHNHAPGLFRGAYRVGTSSVLDLNYNKGLGSWLHTFALIFDDGSIQLINIINGIPYKGYTKPTKTAEIASTRAHIKKYFKY